MMGGLIIRPEAEAELAEAFDLRGFEKMGLTYKGMPPAI